MNITPSATRQPKQARAIRTRERILDQAEHAFAVHGFDVASLTSDILDPAAISVGSFYHQFSDKRAVLHALLEERSDWRTAAERFQAAAEDGASFPDAVRSGMVAFFDAIDEHPEPWWIHFRELHSADTEIRALIEQSWSVWNDAVHSVLHRWAGGDASRSPGRSSFASFGLTGVVRAYLVGDATTRRDLRGTMLDDVVAACVASQTG